MLPDLAGVWATAEPTAAQQNARVVALLIALAIGALSVAILVWVFLRRRRTRLVQPSQTLDMTEHHRLRWTSDPATFAPRPQHWTLALMAQMGICSGQPWESLTHPHPDDVNAQITEAWGVRTRPQLLAELHGLLTWGHRVRFENEVDGWSRLNDLEATEVDRTLAQAARTSEEGAEAWWRFRQVRDNARGITSTRFEAWDLARYVMLCRAGVTVGHLSEAEAWDFAFVVQPWLQETYDSWQQMGEDFDNASWYWNSVSGAAEQDNDRHDQHRQRALLDPRTGPWSHVPWGVEAPASRHLIIDVMVAENLITIQEPEQIATELGAWFDAGVRVRLGEPPLHS